MCTDGTVQFDTGFLDSRLHFGMNSRDDDRVQYRRVMTCAPVTTTGYVSNDYVNGSGLNQTELGDFETSGYQAAKFLKYSYGQSVLFDANTTYAYNDDSFDLDAGYWVSDQEFHLE